MGAEVIAFIWTNRRIIAEVICALLLAGFLYWACVYQPKKIKAKEAEIVALKDQVSSAKEAIVLLETIQAKWGKIDEKTQTKIAKLKDIVFTPYSAFVFLPGGLSTKTMPGTAKTPARP